MTTATLNSSATRYKVLRNLAKCIYQFDNSPHPEKSVRYKCVAESTTSRANQFSHIKAAACINSFIY